jgi:hypothetical protein
MQGNRRVTHRSAALRPFGFAREPCRAASQVCGLFKGIAMRFNET